ncbi:MAG: C2H2-type zinc finger protein [Nitrosopumilaceae archaeon]
MIEIDCGDIESKKYELVVYVSDMLSAMPTMKKHGFVLSPVKENQIIDKGRVVTAIKDYLQSVGEGTNYAVISNGDGLVIKSIYGKIDKEESIPTNSFFSCSHCGFSTRFEGELEVHQRIHYL